MAASGGAASSSSTRPTLLSGVCSSSSSAGTRFVSGPGSQYVKLNVGGSLFYTTIATLTKHDSMLRAMFSGRLEVLTDSEGWVLVDRCGKRFPYILNFLRDDTVGLPDCRQHVTEIQAEAKYYLLQGLFELCQQYLDLSKRVDDEAAVCRVPIISTAKEERALISSTNRPVVKLMLNRHNNKYSYTSQSDDNLLRNLELFDRLVMRFNERILFIKDVGAANEVCSWSFFGGTRKVAEVCCTSIVYATDKKHTKVEFPEARIYEEAMNVLLYENQTVCSACQAGDVAGGGASGGGTPSPVAARGRGTFSLPLQRHTSAPPSSSSPSPTQERTQMDRLLKARQDLNAKLN